MKWESKRTPQIMWADNKPHKIPKFRGRNKERWQDRISKIRNEPIKSGTDLNDITEWGVYEVNDDSK